MVNETVFVTCSDAIHKMQIKFINRFCPLVCAATDGIENIAIKKKDGIPTSLVKDLEKDFLNAESVSFFEQELIDFLNNDPRVIKKTNDDKTLIICSYLDKSLLKSTDPKTSAIKKDLHLGLSDSEKTKKLAITILFIISFFVVVQPQFVKTLVDCIRWNSDVLTKVFLQFQGKIICVVSIIVGFLLYYVLFAKNKKSFIKGAIGYFVDNLIFSSILSIIFYIITILNPYFPIDYLSIVYATLALFTMIFILFILIFTRHK